jgi:hypothetical protein
MSRTRHLVASACLLAAACATPVTLDNTRNARTQELHELQRLQGVFREQYSGTHVFDFPGHGRVTVREITLDGFPGYTYVRCRFHYQNRSPRPVVQAWVSLDVLDAQDRVVSTQACHLVMPTCCAIDRGSYYSDELRTMTYDAHLHEGWKWRIRCTADPQVQEEPLDPPVIEPEPAPPPEPFTIRDPNWVPPRYRWY